MATQKIQLRCSKCARAEEVEIETLVDASASPELKSKVISGELFTWTCQACGQVNLLQHPFAYHDPSEKLMIVMTQADLKAEALPEGYTGRIVRSAGELIEKVKIFDAGLDDAAIEMVKFVTLQEMKKEVPLKFFQMDGADSELTFTYPEKGEMQMLAVGFNVYEDCAGILRRNPQVKESVQGLAEVDQDWLHKFFA